MTPNEVPARTGAAGPASTMAYAGPGETDRAAMPLVMPADEAVTVCAPATREHRADRDLPGC